MPVPGALAARGLGGSAAQFLGYQKEVGLPAIPSWYFTLQIATGGSAWSGEKGL